MNILVTDKCLVIGHTIHDKVTFRPDNMVCVDTGAYESGILSAYDVLSGKIYKA